MPDFTMDELIAGVRRELAMRKNAYPRWIKEKRLKPETAERELLLMQAVHDKLMTLKDDAPAAAGTKVYACVAKNDQGKEMILAGSFGALSAPLCCTDEKLAEALIGLSRRIAEKTGRAVRTVEFAEARVMDQYAPVAKTDRPPGQFDTGIVRTCPECGHASQAAQCIAQTDAGHMFPVPADLAKTLTQADQFALCSNCSAIVRVNGDKLESVTPEEFVDLPLDIRRGLIDGRKLLQRNKAAQS